MDRKGLITPSSDGNSYFYAILEKSNRHLNTFLRTVLDTTYFKGKPLFLKKFRIKCSRSGHSISTCAEKRYTKRSEASNFQKII